MLTTKRKIRPVRLHFGVLYDTKVDKLRKLGLLSGPKKNLTTSLKLGSVKSALLELLTNLKNSFSPTVKVLQAFFFGLPRKPLYMLSHLMQKLLLLEAFKLQLNIYAPDDFVKKGISVLGRSLRKLQRLKFLHLQFEGRYEVPTNVLENFAFDLNRLQNLNRLMLGLNNFKLDGKGIKRICGALRRLRKLEALHISLNSTQALKGKKHEDYKIPKGVKELAESIGRLMKLRSLRINLGDSDHAQEEDISCLVEKIGQLERLEVLELNFTGCGVMPETIFIMTRILPSLKNLRILQLTLYSSEGITPQAYCELWKALAQMNKLETLEIRTGTMENLYAIDNDGFEMLGESLTKLDHLKKLNITLRGSSIINNVAANKLGEYITQAKNLQDIELDFRQFHKLTEEGLVSLKEKLGRMPGVDKVLVRF